MALRDLAKIIAGAFEQHKGMMCQNEELLEIHEGNLLKYVEREMSKELSAAAFAQAQPRIPPINLERRMVDKLSQIYAKPPARKFSKDASETDKSTWQWYLEHLGLDVSGQTLNEYFNLMKSCAWEPYLDTKMQPRIREIPKDRFFVLGMDPSDPLRVTHFVKVMGRKVVEKRVPNSTQTTTDDVAVLHCYTDQEFCIFLSNGEVDQEAMSARGERGGINPYGVIPFVYLNRSKTSINAPADSDMYRMTTLIPLLLGDLNYALKFQCFSLFYGVNVDVDNLPIAPNTFINLKSPKDNPGVSPDLKTLKPEVDSDKALTSIMEQLSLWLQSRGIRPGSIGRVSSENFASGISKMVDEMDTSGDRQKQIPFFKSAEEALFDLIAYKLHPVWARMPSYKQKATFTQDLEYSVQFQEQISWQTRKEQLDEVGKEMELGLLSRESAFQRVNPDLSQEERKSEMDKILKEEQEEAKAEAARNAQKGGFPQ